MNRFKLAWHVFRGRPLTYRIHLKNGTIHVNRDHTWVVENWVENAPVGINLNRRPDDGIWPPISKVVR